ncbi:hypothetical protein SAMN05660216_04748 [Pseudomonas sp. LAMO17WK12:I8]|nr:hypothetical protein SAMN05660216_04748 [Pseudomonas sp. LAMO17WK12:I8]SNY39769.1 hypothetical protein SAMN05660344_04641 [Pseudomonas sp. LAMO17WK12:I11]SNY39952.1 hypothetical protein SAMN05660893_04607 [Pseudomonas sp. LAMO17WK12:I12]SNY40856.1 hypothetical protein SAMN05660700_04750 [Pseudomonas sp. LAMO17WK12:I7]
MQLATNVFPIGYEAIQNSIHLNCLGHLTRLS